jgi:outer membrane protein insertion porin family
VKGWHLGPRIAAVIALVAGAASSRAAGQLPIPDISSSARVRSIDFRFTGTESFSAAELGGVLALKGRGSLYRVRRIVGELPLIQSPATHRFDPVELQKDVVRLGRFYRQSGFLRPAIDYELRANDDGSLVNVTFVIDEGPAVTLRDLWTATRVGDVNSTLAPSLIAEWKKLEAELAAGKGRRFGDADSLLLVDKATAWFRDHGYPSAKVQATRQVDSNQVDVTLRVEPGTRRRLGDITVDGNRSVSDRVVLRELPFRSGQWYSASDLAAGRSRLQQIDLFRQASVSVRPGSPLDTTVGIHVQLTEGGSRLSLAELGYISEGAGISARAQWIHPNFTGGARSLTASLEGQTGIGAIGTQAEKLLRASLALTQPYVHVPELSLVVGPFVEYRDDLEDRSANIGLSTILLYRFGGLSSVALEYQYRASHIYEYRFGNASDGTIGLSKLLALQFPALVDSLGTNVDKSSITLTGSFGKTDDLANPRRGWALRPRAEITVPAPLTTVQFGRLDVTASGFYPLSRKVGLAARISAGRLFPYGKSVPAPGDNPAFSFIRLRDETMTAGGTNDVRGWGSRLLGPKFPDVEARVEGSDTIYSADSYVPVGTLARLTGTLELRLPCPGLPSAWGTQLFLDAGRVWTPDERFTLAASVEEPLRFSTGAGLSYLTPVGAIRFSLGYKLNPSTLDLRSADKVLEAFEKGLPASSVEPEWLQRVHLHLSFGVAL